MENVFDSVYIINKERYNEFVADVEKLAIAMYAIPVFVWPELYKIVDLHKDIAMRVIWKPETTVGRIKEFDKKWFLEKYK